MTEKRHTNEIRFKSVKGSGHKAVFNGSVLARYTDATSHNAITDRSLSFDLAVNAFTNEAIEAFSIKPYKAADECSDSAERFEPTRHYIIKLLLYIGYDPHDISFGLVARLIEMRVRKPNIGFKEMLNYLSVRTDIPVHTLDKALENSFSYYDDRALDCITYVTGTVPLTARDAISDLAVHIRTKYFDEFYSRHE